MIVAALFWILALIHFLPAIAALAPSQISALYGIAPTDKALMTLLQHRAVLLGLVGAAFACAAHLSEVRWPVLIGGTISMISFILIAALNSELGGSLRRIAIVDAIGLPAVVALVYLLLKSQAELAS